MRYCCAELKEKRVPEQGKSILSFGVRRYESANRKNKRRELEIVKNSRSEKNLILKNSRSEKNLIMPFDNNENRRTFEVCYMDCEKRLNPIAEWENEDIWNYSRYWKLEQSVLYKEGFKRLGCIGCPIARKTVREMEFRRWPKYREQYIWTFGKMMEERKKRGMTLMENAKTAEDWFEWWMSDKAADDKYETQIILELDGIY